MAHTLLGLSNGNEQVNLDVGHDVDADHVSVCCQTDLTMADMALEMECQNLHAENMDLKSKLVSCDLLSEFQNNDEKVRCLPNVTLLFSILSKTAVERYPIHVIFSASVVNLHAITDESNNPVPRLSV